MNSIQIQNSLFLQSGVQELAQRLPLIARTITEEPANASAWADLAVILRCSDKLPAAISIYRRALALKPDSVSVLSNLGGALRTAGQFEEAISHLTQAVQLAPQLAAAHFNLGLAFEDSGLLPQAVSSYKQALLIEPHRRDAGEQLAFSLLRMGDFREGLRIYERRLLWEPRLRRNFEQPKWDGAKFHGKTLLLHSEQGRGDTLQFVRYVPAIKKLGGTVILECPSDLVDVVATVVNGADHIISQGQPLPKFDFHASLMSLPYILETTLDSIPHKTPYLGVCDSALNSMRISKTPCMKVGIVWASGHEDVGAHKRSAALEDFLPLAELSNVSLYSLQVDPAARQLYDSGCHHFIQDVGRQFKSFAHTADAIRQLDLVITVDTAVLHLAGAMGKPVWAILPYAAEWRWLQHRSDSPWYPNLRLYRQPKPFDWTSVFTRVAADLKEVSA